MLCDRRLKQGSGALRQEVKVHKNKNKSKLDRGALRKEGKAKQRMH